MPIRFRCVYCDKLLGIARRKAGAVVNCPQCGQPLIVPTPEPEPEPEPERTAAPSHAAAPPAGAPGKLFERDDFDVLLEPDATFRTPDPPPAARRPKPAPVPNPLPPQTFAAERTLPAAPDDFGNLDEPAPTRRKEARGIVISKSMLILMILAVIGLMGLAFGGGVLVGRMLNSGS